MTQPLEVVTLGEPLIQLTPRSGVRLADATELEIHTAGAEANVALAMARLGHHVAYVGRVGSDPFGDRILDVLRTAGVHTDPVVRDQDRPTGVYVKDYDGGQSRMHYYRRGSAATRLTFEDLRPYLGLPRLFHTTGVTAALSPECLTAVQELARHTRTTGEALMSFDVNYRPALWDPSEAGPVLLDLARMADIVFVGCDEAHHLWGTAHPQKIRALLPQVPHLVVKDSSSAAYSFMNDTTIAVPALPTAVVEPVGAGDAFAAGFLSAVLNEADHRTALRYGHLLASAALSSVADQVVPPPPTQMAAAASVDDQTWSRGRLPIAGAAKCRTQAPAEDQLLSAQGGRR
ncbi:sugar kinase [Terrabacter terrigena]|uniref:Sugar kinase n=1 Tax=Terrabacter terrigena TaxID=574718 RepID=A0ABW3N4B5_9MICO